METLKERLTRLRLKNKLTQLDVATELGINNSAYGKIESGATALTVDRLIKLSKILNTSIDEILGLDKKQVSESEKRKKVVFLPIEIDDNEYDLLTSKILK